MFKLAQKRTVKWPVTISIPADGGQVIKASITAEFEVLSQEELEQNAQEGRDLLERAVVGWKGVQDAEGNELEFSDANRKQFLGITYVRAALYNAYAEVQQGRAAARKN